MTFRRPSDALQTPFRTIFQRASHALLFLQTPFRPPSHTSPIPPYVCALPLDRIAHANAEAATVRPMSQSDRRKCAVSPDAQGCGS
jgi:hypothetical protein